MGEKDFSYRLSKISIFKENNKNYFLNAGSSKLTFSHLKQLIDQSNDSF